MADETSKPQEQTDSESLAGGRADQAAEAGASTGVVEAADDVELDAEAALRDVESSVEAMTGGAAPFAMPDLASKAGLSDEPTGINLLGDVSLKVKVELGRTLMYVEDVLRLNADSIVELDKAAGDPVDIFVNGRLVARGEVLVLNENFCVRVSEIVDSGAESEA